MRATHITAIITHYCYIVIHMDTLTNIATPHTILTYGWLITLLLQKVTLLANSCCYITVAAIRVAPAVNRLSAIRCATEDYAATWRYADARCYYDTY